MEALSSLKLSHILLDIETVPLQPSYEGYPHREELVGGQDALHSPGSSCKESYYERAGIWAEFGKIVCISVGYFVVKNGQRQFRVRSFVGEERDILENFSYLVNQFSVGGSTYWRRL